MIWRNSIADLDYYNGEEDCYCEKIVTAGDLILQGFFSPVNQITGIIITLWSADGLTNYGDMGSYFDVWYGVEPTTGRYFFNARLNSFAPEMCEHKCWILQFQVFSSGQGRVFNKYTERYCQSDCCDTARGVIIGEALEAGTEPPTPGMSSPLFGDCGERLVRLVTINTCYDPFSDEYYGVPPVVLSGTADFSLTKISVFSGRIVQRPREIVREISYNCKLQKSESRRQFLLEGFTKFPAWKMNEIENQLHAEQIWVDSYPNMKQYQFYGGSVFRKPDGLKNCEEIFKLEAILEECPIRKYFGCGEPCEGTPGALGFGQFFVIPDNYSEGQPIYNDAKEPVAYGTDDILDYLRNQDGVTSAELVATSPVECSYYAIIGMSGSFLPGSLYIGNTSPANRTYALNVDEINEICEFITPGCTAPVLDYVIGIENTCAAPVLDYIEVAVTSPVNIDITPYGGWIIDTEEAQADNNQVLFTLHVTNTSIIPGAGEVINLAGEIIGIMGSAGRPQETVLLNSSNNTGLNDDQNITIDAYGVIRYSGEPTTYNEGVSIEIDLTDLIYNL